MHHPSPKHNSDGASFDRGLKADGTEILNLSRERVGKSPPVLYSIYRVLGGERRPSFESPGSAPSYSPCVVEASTTAP